MCSEGYLVLDGISLESCSGGASNFFFFFFFFFLLLLLLYDMDVSFHRLFLPGTSLEPAVIPTAQASSFTLQYFPYYV